MNEIRALNQLCSAVQETFVPLDDIHYLLSFITKRIRKIKNWNRKDPISLAIQSDQELILLRNFDVIFFDVKFKKLVRFIN